MTWKGKLKEVTKKFKDSEKGFQQSKDGSNNLQRLGDLLDEDWGDEERSDVHIEEAHFYGEERPTKNIRVRDFDSIPTKPENEKPRPHSLSPEAKRISIIITILATSLAGAAKLIWELYSYLR